jgi:CBS domain-containing protein
MEDTPLRVSDVLLPIVGTASVEQPIAEVAHSLSQGGGLLAVTSEGEPAGLVDITDIVRAVAVLGTEVGWLRAADIMDSEIETVTHDADLGQAREHMRARFLDELAVLEHGQLVGVVSAS